MRRWVVLAGWLLTAGCAPEEPLDHYWDERSCSFEGDGDVSAYRVCQVYARRAGASALVVHLSAGKDFGDLGHEYFSHPVLTLTLAPTQPAGEVQCRGEDLLLPAPLTVPEGEAYLLTSPGAVTAPVPWYLGEGSLQVRELELTTQRESERERAALRLDLQLDGVTLRAVGDPDGPPWGALSGNLELTATDPP